MFQHEDFSRQLVWALQRYVQVDIQGPEKFFLKKKPWSRLLLLGRTPINAMSSQKWLILQISKMR